MKTVAAAVLFSICEVALPRWFAFGVGSMGLERAVKNARFLRGESIFETLTWFLAYDREGQDRLPMKMDRNRGFKYEDTRREGQRSRSTVSLLRVAN